MCKLFVGANPKLWENQTRSFRMEGMVTSIRLENIFWSVLEDIAARDQITIPQLLHQLYYESLDEGLDVSNFTSFLRVCCLRFKNLQLKELLPRGDNTSLEKLTAEEIPEREARLKSPDLSASLQ